MPQRYCYFLVVFIFGISYTSQGQDNFPRLLSVDTPFCKIIPLSNPLRTTYSRIVTRNAGSSPEKSIQPLSPSFYVQHLGFFCKKELQVEKILTIPLKIRVGKVNGY